MDILTKDLVKRNFVPGDEWLYYKLYSGPKTLENILVNRILGLVDLLLKENIIDKFFFIRYVDTDYHIRIRFHLQDSRLGGEVIHRMNILLDPYMNDRIIHNIVMDTYVREIERYGYNTIELIETYFSNESLEMMTLWKNKEISENDKWLYIFFDIDRALKDFGLTLEEKLYFSEKGKDAYNQEFRIGKATRLQIDKKYRTVLERIDKFNYSELFEISGSYCIGKNTEIIHKIVELNNDKNLDVGFNDLIFSLIHMKINRFFRTNQRFVECVLYNFIYKYYRSELAKIKYSKKEKVC